MTIAVDLGRKATKTNKHWFLIKWIFGPPSSRCSSNLEIMCFKFSFYFCFIFQTKFCFDLVHSNTYIGFHKTDSGPQAARYLDVSSIFIVSEKAMYNKYLKQ